MEAMGRLEALSSLATLAADHPGWAYADVTPADSEPRFHARDLGHPLLRPDECVCNDVELGPPGTVLLVTGSNMSGKSTLLRSIGLAAVLSGAGAPVCARQLRLPAVTLFTSMRVQDSLEAGVSFFMAELLRLKALLDAAPLPLGDPRRLEAHASDGERPLLYLVDEILQGTNSEERQQAGRRLIRHLLRRWALGAVTTHDLELHREPEVEAAAVLVHFRETLDEAGDGLHFDYRLREGLATTRNALRLAENVGLTDPDQS
jgi:DNA mismatch repair ATPase MutS